MVCLRLIPFCVLVFPAEDLFLSSDALLSPGRLCLSEVLLSSDMILVPAGLLFPDGL